MSFEVRDCLLLEQRYVIRYCFRKRMIPGDIVKEMRQIYGSKCYDESFILKLFNRYQDISAKGQQSKYRIPSVKVEEVKMAKLLVAKNKKISMKSLSDALGVSLTKTFTIMTDHLGMTMVGHEWTRIDEGKELSPQNIHFDITEDEVADQILESGGGLGEGPFEFNTDNIGNLI